MNSQIVIAILAIIAYFALKLLRIGRREKGLPPGPPTTPVLGNLLQIPPRYAHLKMQEWGREYGPVISLKLFGATMIVLNDAASVREILDRKSSSSSDRAPTYINNELIANHNHILLANGKRSALFRKLWNVTLAKEKVAEHIPLQHAEAAAVLYNVLKRPDTFYQEMRRYSASLTLSIAYGKRAPTFSGKDQSGFSVQEFYRLEHDFNFFLEVGAAPPIDLLPILKYTPSFLAPWKAQAQKTKKEMKNLYINTLFREVKERMAKGEVTNCWMAKIIERNDGLNDESLAWNGGVMMEGGSDTTSGALLTFVLSCVLYPEAVAKAHAELDKVIGQDRSPTIEDIKNLPYCRAFILEVMRFRPTAPAGVPHVLTKEETYKGYVLPAGSLVVGNTWAVLHDENSYDDPDNFHPERFIKNEFGVKESNEDWRNTFPYGAGRRICLGMHLAENSLAITIPKLLWAFNYGRAKDESGTEIAVSADAFEPGHLTAPVPFKCTITPRNEKVKAIIEKEYNEARSLLSKYEY